MSDDILTVADVRKIVEDQLATMPENLARHARRHLVEPYRSEQSWSYGPELFDCWVVLVDAKTSSNTGIAYCHAGIWKPQLKWILVTVEIRDPLDTNVGQDSGWFASLEAAFGDSWMSEGC